MIKSFKIKERKLYKIKKLLSLLSVFTISGTSVPTTIAAIPYQKEEILNNNINYSETEILSWKKLSDINFINKNGIFKKRNILSSLDSKSVNSGRLIGRDPGGYFTAFFEGKLVNSSDKKRKILGFYSPEINFYQLDRKKIIFLINKNGMMSFFIVTKNNKVYYGLAIPGFANPLNNPAAFLKELSQFNNKNIVDAFYFDEKIYLVSNDNNIYEYNLDNEKINLFFNINSNFLYYKVYSDHFSLIMSDNNVYDYFLIKYLNDNNIMNLLREWENDYNKWESEVNRQIKEDVLTFTDAQKRSWKDDKNFQLRTQISLLKDKLSIIKNHDEINKINDIILNLKNEINKIYEDIDRLGTKINNIKEELEKKLSKTCEANELMGDFNDLLSPIPAFSTITGSLKSITTISCKIFKL